MDQFKSWVCPRCGYKHFGHPNITYHGIRNWFLRQLFGCPNRPHFHVQCLNCYGKVTEEV
jgi:predicted nucleic-acid-binding Zn-ribbon protein